MNHSFIQAKPRGKRLWEQPPDFPQKNSLCDKFFLFAQKFFCWFENLTTKKLWVKNILTAGVFNSEKFG